MLFFPSLSSAKKQFYSIPIAIDVIFLLFNTYEYYYWYLYTEFDTISRSILIVSILLAFAVLLMFTSFYKVICTDAGKVTINQVRKISIHSKTLSLTWIKWQEALEDLLF